MAKRAVQDTNMGVAAWMAMSVTTLGVLLQRCIVQALCGAGSGTAMAFSPRVPAPGRSAPWWCPGHALRPPSPLSRLCA
jgi:hypothetical protein